MRTFECAGYEIPQLVEYRKGIERFFDLESEIATFRSKDEMLASMDRIVGDEPWRRKLMIGAKKRVIAEHSYQHRVKEMIGDLL